VRIDNVVGFQNFTSSAIASTALACSTALFRNVTTGVLANAAVLSVGGSTGAIRFRDDGVAPVSNVGMRLVAGIVPYFYQGDLTRLQFIADSVPGNADVQITYVYVQDQ